MSARFTPAPQPAGFNKLDFDYESELVTPRITPPRKLLKGYRTGTNLQNYKMSKRNATKSPLLRLPAELRNMIYGYALGGETVHVVRPTVIDDRSGPGGKINGPDGPRGPVGARRTITSDITYTLCRLAQDHDQRKATSIRRGRAENQAFDYADHHDRFGCFDSWTRVIKKTKRPLKRPERPGLDILRTCKQIHHETALLPYLLNHFTFSSSDCFAMFINSLVPAQARAIQSMTLDNGVWTNFCIPTLQLQQLKGLKDVTVFGRFARNERSDSLYDHQSTNTEMMETMEVLKGFGVESARVCLTSLYKGDRKEDGIVQWARVWSRLTEGVVEGRWEVGERVQTSRLVGC